VANPLPVNQIISPGLIEHLKTCEGSSFCTELKKLIAAYEEVAFPQHYMTYEDCDWVGPEKPDGTPRRCILALGHPLMKIGYKGHAPDMAVPGEKPTRTADPHGYPPAPGLKADQMTEDPHAKG
jgi:hypothetical protein